MVRPCELSGFNQDSPSLRIIASFPIFQSSSWSCTQTGSLISRAVCLSFGLLFVRLVDWINQGCRHHPGVERCFQGEAHQIHRGPKRTTGDESVPFCTLFCMVPWMMIRIYDDTSNKSCIAVTDRWPEVGRPTSGGHQPAILEVGVKELNKKFPLRLCKATALWSCQEPAVQARSAPIFEYKIKKKPLYAPGSHRLRQICRDRVTVTETLQRHRVSQASKK